MCALPPPTEGRGQGLAGGAGLADAIIFTRDLVSEPANILYPAEFARRVKALESLGLEVEILGEPEMMKLGMGSLLGVGQGSVRESQLAVIQWKGAADKTAQPIAFVGKGVCFDTGGISIKPADGMEDMKWDMGGAGAVAGLMHALAGRKAKVNAVGILGLVENMPDGNAQRPGDVVTSMSGQTIEVINTDAEGRLVLADALWYCQDRFKPKFMVDLATLTGAIIIALGNDYAGLFSNNDELAATCSPPPRPRASRCGACRCRRSTTRTSTRLIADMKNIGGRARRLDHRGPVHPALRQRPALGAPGHRLHRLEEALDRRHHPRRRHRLRRAPAEPPGRREVRGLIAGRARPCEVWFYHLERTGLDQALPELLEKTLQRGWKAIVRSAAADRIDHLDGWLWSYRDDSFLPHGRRRAGAARQPILLAPRDVNENRAEFLFALDEPPRDLGRYERCVILFSSDDDDAVSRARGLWKTYKAAGATVTYHQQTDDGRWTRRA